MDPAALAKSRAYWNFSRSRPFHSDLQPFIQCPSSFWTWPPLSVITKNSCRLSPSSQVDSRPVFSLSLLSLHKRTPSAPGHPIPLLMAQACKGQCPRIPSIAKSSSPLSLYVIGMTEFKRSSGPVGLALSRFLFFYLVISTSTSHRISCGGTSMFKLGDVVAFFRGFLARAVGCR